MACREYRMYRKYTRAFGVMLEYGEQKEWAALVAGRPERGDALRLGERLWHPALPTGRTRDPWKNGAIQVSRRLLQRERGGVARRFEFSEFRDDSGRRSFDPFRENLGQELPAGIVGLIGPPSRGSRCAPSRGSPRVFNITPILGRCAGTQLVCPIPKRSSGV